MTTARITTVATKELGLRWTEFDRNDRIITKEKFFKTEKARGTFVTKVQEKDNFYNIVEYHN